MGSGVLVGLLRITLVIAPACGRFEFSPVPDGGANGDIGIDLLGDAAPATCAPGLLVCDLLDDPVLDTVRWNDNAGTLTRDTTVVHRGTASLRTSMPVAPPGSEFGAYIGHGGPEIAGASELWIRAWMRTSAVPLSTNALELMTLQQPAAQGNFVFARSNDTELYSQFDDMVTGTSAPIPVDTWFCVVWHVTIATASAGSSALTSDVLPATTLSNTTTQGVPPVSVVAFGPYFATSNITVQQPAFDMWFDDLIIDDAPVTCAD